MMGKAIELFECGWDKDSLLKGVSPLASGALSETNSACSQEQKLSRDHTRKKADGMLLARLVPHSGRVQSRSVSPACLSLSPPKLPMVILTFGLFATISFQSYSCCDLLVTTLWTDPSLATKFCS